jgi:hypothetical protein
MDRTRSHTYSVLFALPLLLLYEVGALYLTTSEGSSLRNGADVLLRTLLHIGGVEGTLALTLVLLAAGVVILVHERRTHHVPLRLPSFLGMAAESIVYALLLGVVVGTATRVLLEGIAIAFAAGPFQGLTLTEAIVLSLGAGIYEELVFRVLLVGGLFAVFRGGGLPGTQAGVYSVILAALIFSGFHYIGPYGDAWALPSFLFRFLAGVAFSVLFLLRGFGITAWTHALYDVFLVLALAA